MASWDVGTTMPVQVMMRPLLNAQSSPLLASIDTQAEIADALEYKVRVLNVGIVKIMPRFMLKTPAMRRLAKATQKIVDRMQRTHTAAQRVGMYEDVVDAYLALHASDPQFLPESDLSLPLGAILMTAMYMGDQVASPFTGWCRIPSCTSESRPKRTRCGPRAIPARMTSVQTGST